MIGLSKSGLNFHSMDQSLSKAIFLIITDEDDAQSQLEIISQIATIFADRDNTEKFVSGKSSSELIAFVKSYGH
jgi:mannitol/fructose-specific phosphotransferase system IIA component (Ntr-type)